MICRLGLSCQQCLSHYKYCQFYGNRPCFLITFPSSEAIQHDAFFPSVNNSTAYSSAGQPLSLTISADSIGVSFMVMETNGLIFEQHLITKASTAQYAGNAIWGMKDCLGELPPKQAIQLYMAQIDCHLIHACKVMPNARKVHTEELWNIQHAYLC